MKNKTQKKHRFNIIDFALIVTVIACLIGIAVRYNLGASVLQSSDTATVTVMIRNLLDDNADQLGFDANNIVISGSSAGAITVMQAEYELCNKTKWAAGLP